MIGRNKFKILLLSVLISASIFYVFFLTYDIITLNFFGRISKIIKFAALLIIGGNIVAVLYNPIDRRDSIILTSAYLLTLAADVFMTILYYPIPGFILFLCVQMIYIIRHTGFKIPKKRLLFMIAIPAIIIMAGIFILYIDKVWIRLLTSIYAGVLTASLIAAWYALRYKTLPLLNARMAALGMTLFFLCDISLGVYTVSSQPVIGLLVWFFYLPGQYLLSLSGVKTVILLKQSE